MPTLLFVCFPSYDILYLYCSISVIGVGVTEAGLAHKDTQAMKDFYTILSTYQPLHGQRGTKLIIIDMDNLPNNGSKLREYMLAHAATDDNKNDNGMKEFLTTQVFFCNTMVDRITSSRPGSNGMVPQCEPLPLKALVIGDDEDQYIQQQGRIFLSSTSSSTSSSPLPGIWLRPTQKELQKDLDLKLLIANGTHTAIAHLLALLGYTMTTILSDSQQTIFMEYLDTLVEGQILPSYTYKNNNEYPTSVSEDAEAVWKDWKQRLIHPHFGLSTFFITQNGTAKGGIRWGPTVQALLLDDAADTACPPPQVSFALAYAVLLRWLTGVPTSSSSDGIYRGWLNGFLPSSSSMDNTTTTAMTNIPYPTSTGVEYADGLCYHLQEGWYDFKCPLPDLVHKLRMCLTTNAQPQDCRDAIRYYLIHDQGGNLSDPTTTTTPNRHFEDLVDATAVLYARLIAGDDLLKMLQEFNSATYGIGFTNPCSALSLTTTSTTMVSPSTIQRSTGSVSALAAAATPRSTRPLYYRKYSIPDSSHLLDRPVTLSSIDDVVMAEVQGVIAIDLHTHLLPPTHGPLCSWGIDELLTYVSRDISSN